MKKYISLLVAISVAPTFALAQSVESEVDAELKQAAQTQTLPSNIAVETKVTPVTGQTIYIQTSPSLANNAVAETAAVQKQPTTVIESTPLAENKAEAIRRARQEAELATESRIVEKLEAARMEDEKRRADILFGTKLNTAPEAVATQAVAPVIAAPVVDQNAAAAQAAEKITAEKTQAPVIIEKVIIQQPAEEKKAEAVKEEIKAEVKETAAPKEDTRQIVREELNNALRVQEEETLLAEPTTVKYVGGILGVGDVPDTSNVNGNYALGVAFGSKVDNIIIEGSFVYSNYTVKDPYSSSYPSYPGYPGSYATSTSSAYDVDVNQYTGSLAAKVQLFDGVVRPVFGGLVAYSYRNYAWSNNPYSSYYNTDSDANSHAIDIGAIAGVDFEFNSKYSLGLDFRYMFNLASRVNVDNQTYAPYSNDSELEKQQYYLMSIVGRVNF